MLQVIREKRHQQQDQLIGGMKQVTQQDNLKEVFQEGVSVLQFQEATLQQPHVLKI